MKHKFALENYCLKIKKCIRFDNSKIDSKILLAGEMRYNYGPSLKRLSVGTEVLQMGARREKMLFRHVTGPIVNDLKYDTLQSHENSINSLNATRN